MSRNQKCPKCKKSPLDGTVLICDNDCGTSYCEFCNFEWHKDAKTHNLIAGHSQTCGNSDNESESDSDSESEYVNPKNTSESDDSSNNPEKSESSNGSNSYVEPDSNSDSDSDSSASYNENPRYPMQQQSRRH